MARYFGNDIYHYFDKLPFVNDLDFSNSVNGRYFRA